MFGIAARLAVNDSVSIAIVLQAVLVYFGPLHFLSCNCLWKAYARMKIETSRYKHDRQT